MLRGLTAALACAVLLSGCASATRGWEETLTVTSTPSEAKAEIIVTNASQPVAANSGSSGADPTPAPAPVVREPFVCTTPCATKIARSADIVVRISKPGYETAMIPLKKEISNTGAAGFAGNLLLGGVVGMAVDTASGAAMDHTPNPVIVTLRPVASAPSRPVRRTPPRRTPAAESAPRVGM